jgi:hypothetical protein
MGLGEQGNGSQGVDGGMDYSSGTLRWKNQQWAMPELGIGELTFLSIFAEHQILTV